ncbi:MAG: GNAT family N-acetyltransferase [Aurantibacter sp.]
MEIDILHRDANNSSMQKQVSELFNQLDSKLKQLPLQRILETNNNIVFAICREGKTIIGIAAMVTYRVISGHKGMIEDVVVDTSQRGRGIGRKLMEKLLEEGRKLDLDEVLLFSAHHRTPAINLYTSLGFQLKDSGLYRLMLD